MWSCGVVAHVLLTGRMPFDPSTYSWVHGSADLDVVPELFAPASPDAFSFVRTLLRRDPRARPTASEALAHAWLNPGKGEDSEPRAATLLLTPKRLRESHMEEIRAAEGWLQPECAQSLGGVATSLRTPPGEDFKLPRPLDSRTARADLGTRGIASMTLTAGGDTLRHADKERMLHARPSPLSVMDAMQEGTRRSVPSSPPPQPSPLRPHTDVAMACAPGGMKHALAVGHTRLARTITKRRIVPGLGR